MDLHELKSTDQWLGLLEELSAETGMEATLTNANGRILLEVGQRFSLCKKIREKPDALTFICSQSSAAILAMIKKTGRPLVEECDAGLLRLAIPVMWEGALIGQVIACGLRGDDVDTYLVSRQVGMDEESVRALAEFSPVGDEDQLESLVERYLERVNSPSMPITESTYSVD